MRRFHWVLVAVLALGVFPLACGGSDDTEPADGEDAIDTSDGGADADADSPAEADAEAGADADADSPAEADAEAGADADADADADATACIDPAAPGPSGMNSGQDCLGCHGAGGRAPRMTVAGTLYGDAAGTSRVGGATIVVTGADGTEVRMVTGTDGNFWSNAAVSYPGHARASKCPDDQTMVSSVTTGGCNSRHNAGMRIHLP